MSINAILLEAVALTKYVEADYNGVRIKIAPHVLYTKHESIYVDALTFLRDGQPPKEIKLGSFNLAGLKNAAVIEEHFEIWPLFEPETERYVGNTLLAVERS